jgi:hypothetical protein
MFIDDLPAQTSTVGLPAGKPYSSPATPFLDVVTYATGSTVRT